MQLSSGEGESKRPSQLNAGKPIPHCHSDISPPTESTSDPTCEFERQSFVIGIDQLVLPCISHLNIFCLSSIMYTKQHQVNSGEKVRTLNGRIAFEPRDPNSLTAKGTFTNGAPQQLSPKGFIGDLL